MTNADSTRQLAPLYEKSDLVVRKDTAKAVNEDRIILRGWIDVLLVARIMMIGSKMDPFFS